MFFDPLYLLFIAPALLLSFYAQAKVKSSFAKYSRIPSSRGLSGADAAGRILAGAGVTNVQIERTPGHLSDHYDPRTRVLRLSDATWGDRSIAAVGVAAHEAGHAIQHANGYPFLAIRNLLVRFAPLGNLAIPMILFGMIFNWFNLVLAGIAFFSLIVLFQVFTLPVEFDASRRALASLRKTGLVQGDEATGVRKVLTAAALTYIAAAAAAISQLLYFLLRAGVLGGRRQTA